MLTEVRSSYKREEYEVDMSQRGLLQRSAGGPGVILRGWIPSGRGIFLDSDDLGHGNQCTPALLQHSLRRQPRYQVSVYGSFSEFSSPRYAEL